MIKYRFNMKGAVGLFVRKEVLIIWTEKKSREEYIRIQGLICKCLCSKESAHEERDQLGNHPCVLVYIFGV